MCQDNLPSLHIYIYIYICMYIYICLFVFQSCCFASAQKFIELGPYDEKSAALIDKVSLRGQYQWLRPPMQSAFRLVTQLKLLLRVTVCVCCCWCCCCCCCRSSYAQLYIVTLGALNGDPLCRMPPGRWWAKFWRTWGPSPTRLHWWLSMARNSFCAIRVWLNCMELLDR